MHGVRHWCLSLGLSLSLSTTAAADIPAAADGATLAAACSSCHGRAAERESSLPRLDTQTFAELERKLLAYRDGSLQGTLMNRIASGFSEAELRAIAAVLAQP